MTAATCPFPHSSKCGPIEAIRRLQQDDLYALFPHSSKCGPIEAQPTPPGCTDTIQFPHSSKCGPIEATGINTIGRLALGFRTHRSAAPLKRLCWAPLSGVAQFPHSSKCGPIEAESVESHGAGVVRFPHSSKCGPIEAGRCRMTATGSRGCFRTHRSAAPLKRPAGDFSLFPVL